jgi:hypothetical protein
MLNGGQASGSAFLVFLIGIWELRNWCDLNLFAL